MGQEAAVFSGAVFRLFRACAGQETEIGISSGARGSTNRPCELDLPPLIGLLLFICSHNILLRPRALALRPMSTPKQAFYEVILVLFPHV